MKKQPRRSSDFVHEIAPGERKKLSEWIREENHDRKAFPELFHDGQFGLHDKNRKRKITATQNYSHKVLNINRKYAQSSDYVFVGQQYLERHPLKTIFQFHFKEAYKQRQQMEAKKSKPTMPLMSLRQFQGLLLIGKPSEMKYLQEWNN